MNEVSVLIPCFNEEENIDKCVNIISNFPWIHEIIVVDDGSQDKTVLVAKSIKKDNLKVIGYKKNRGKGYAVRYGLEHSSGEIAVIQDADMATPPEELQQIIQPIIDQRADFVNGSRMIYPMERGAMKGMHVFGNRIFAFIVSALIRKKLTDTLCGFKAFRIENLKNKLKENTWPDFELILQAKKNKMRIVEIPIHYKKRIAGKSKMKTFRHAYRMSIILFKTVI